MKTVALGKCDLCGRDAVAFDRTAVFDGYESDEQGKAWAKYKPGELRRYCRNHKPVPATVTGSEPQ
jgi:hypothetical protein